LTTRIIVFAKAPAPGAVKTRLVPALGVEGAAKLHERLVTHALATAAAASVGPVELCCAPDASHPFFAACVAAHDVALTVQGEGDLGDRMQRAAGRTVAAGDSVVIIGADCPVLTADQLRGAAAALDEGCDAALISAEDGGYVLIALHRVDRELFRGVRWGESDVMSSTAARLAALGWRWRHLDTLWDVDRPEDLERLRALGPQWH
jgi:rSAM/selenodomain-associated transferase 1